MGRIDWENHISKGPGYWETFFDRLRIAVTALVILCFLAVTAIVKFSSHDARTFLSLFFPVAGPRDAIFVVVVLGTIAEVTMTLGHLWMRHPDRSLPYWPLAIPSPLSAKPLLTLRPLSSFLFHNRVLDYGTVILFYCALYATLFGYGSVRAWSLFVSVVLFHLLCVLDLWRFLNSHQWLFCLTSLLVDDSPEVSIRLYLAGLYFWAGFQKLFSRSFYNNIAPSTFYWVYDALDVIYERFTILGDYVSEDRVFLITSIFGVGLETLMGAVFLFYQFVPRLMLDLALYFNIFLHLYIVAFIGYKNGIMTFWAWNMMVMTLSQLVFAPNPLLNGVPRPSFSHWHALMLFVFVLLPITVLIGKCPNGTLSHAYFAPGWYGQSYVVLHKEALRNVPTHVNQISMEYFAVDSNRNYFRVLVRKLEECVKNNVITKRKLLQVLRSKVANLDNTNEDVDLVAWLADNVVILNDAWVDMTHNLGPADPWKTFFGAGPTSFFQTLVDEVIQYPGFHLCVDQFSLLGTHTMLKELYCDTDIRVATTIPITSSIFYANANFGEKKDR